MPAGRPTKYDSKYCEEIIELMGQGFSAEAFAGKIGISKQTLYNWLNTHPEFMDAKRHGEAKSQAFFEDLGLQGMFNRYQDKTFNTSNWIFQMKNRFKWRDQVETINKTEYKNPEEMSATELEDVLRTTESSLDNLRQLLKEKKIASNPNSD